MRSPSSIMIHSFDGAKISVRRLPNEGKPRLILSHGNGFAIEGYRAFWSLLADDYDLVLFDLRNHGASGATEIAAHSIAAMAGDHAAVADACGESFGARETFGVFHSVSAIAATLASASRRLWDGVVLVDPPLVSLEEGEGIVRSADDRLAQYARKRAASFPDAEALAAEFSAGAGRNWTQGAALAMARAVTRPSPDGGVELICAGEYEARIYEENGRTPSFAAAGAMKDRVAILGADADAPRALHPALNCRAAALKYGLEYEAVPGASHMLQIENPVAAAAALRRLLASLRRS
jgi:pimeloyl-ACP methyl ester carboxylesterase